MTTEVLFFLSVGAGFLPRADATFFIFPTYRARGWTPELPRRGSVSYISPNYFSVLKKVEYTLAINVLLQYFVTRFKDNIAGVSSKSSPPLHIVCPYLTIYVSINMQHKQKQQNPNTSPI